MQPVSCGFIGGGRITAIFLEALLRRGLAPDSITVSDKDEDVLARLEARFPGVTTTRDNGRPAGCALVFLALHPPAMKEALPTLGRCVRPDAVVASLAPVLRLEQLATLLGGFERLARVIPNAPSVVGAGYNPVAFAPGLPAEARRRLEAVLDALGSHPVVPEDTLEAYAILAAMGPTYFWFQWQTLRELGVSFGLDAPSVDAALAAMVDGAAKTLFGWGRPYEEVADLVPVKPLAAAEAGIRGAYEGALPALHAKLRGA